MPLFLTRDIVYRMLQRELPDNVYPDGAPSAFFSTAENDAVASVAATGYANLERIYANYWPQSADERIADWEIKVFGYQLPGTLALADRRTRVIARLRQRLGFRKSDIKAIVLSTIGTDKIVEIINWGCDEGTWILDDNQLGITTILGIGPRLRAVNPLACEMSAADFGLTDQDIQDIRDGAYTYGVMIYGYTLTAAEFRQVDADLSVYEPARSRHIIRDGLDPYNQVHTIVTGIDGGDAGSTGGSGIDGGDAGGTGSGGIDGGGA